MLRYVIPIPKTKKIVFGNEFKDKQKETKKGAKTELNITLSRKQVEDSINRGFHGVESSYYMLFELHMILFIYALKLREKAMVLVSKDMVESTKAYREAAGVFDYVCKIDHRDWSYIEKFPELTSPVCSSLKLLCLAVGQAVTANKAEEKGTSASLVAKLHYGVTQFVAEANAALLSKTNTQVKQLSSRFLDYVRTLGALHELKTGKHFAESLESEGELGEAIGVLRRALTKAKTTTQFRDDTWKSIFKKEIEKVSTLMNKYECLNKSMMVQRIPVEADLPTLQGDKIVKLIPYIGQID
ncbi:BRO1 domain-containing protein [Hirschfeldia incana]|nr:BRO1 domain-containing protein [Hirschfeldia incana]